MPCILLLLLLAMPRVALVLMWFFSNYLERAYHGILLPILGFFFAPLTTIVYAWMMNTHRGLEGPNLLILIVAIIIDIGGLGGGSRYRNR